jgi:Uma2 family endonuclease
MTAPAAPALMTADEFLRFPDGGGLELVNGALQENPMGAISSWLGGQLFRLLAHQLLSHPVGLAFPQETGLAIWPDNPRLVRKPDAMFVRTDRLPGWKIPRAG